MKTFKDFGMFHFSEMRFVAIFGMHYSVRSVYEIDSPACQFSALDCSVSLQDR